MAGVFWQEESRWRECFGKRSLDGGSVLARGV
jgi:hypothetical protein